MGSTECSALHDRHRRTDARLEPHGYRHRPLDPISRRKRRPRVREVELGIEILRGSRGIDARAPKQCGDELTRTTGRWHSGLQAANSIANIQVDDCPFLGRAIPVLHQNPLFLWASLRRKPDCCTGLARGH